MNRSKQIRQLIQKSKDSIQVESTTDSNDWLDNLFESELAKAHNEPVILQKPNPDAKYEEIISYDANPDCKHVWLKSRCQLCPAKKLMPFQIDGVKFSEASHFRTGIFDEQGLGKTVQALAILRLHAQELLPAVIVVKSTLKKQWFKQIENWCSGRGDFLTQVLYTGEERPIPFAFGIYIVSYEILKTEGLFDGIPIKLVIADECQKITNHTAKRSKAFLALCEKADHVLALSGTPIRNHAGEYYTILHALQPARFNDYNQFIKEDCDSYETQYGYKVGGIADIEAFKHKTEDFVIRRLKKDVMPEMPEKERVFYHVEMDGKFAKAYKAAMKELDELMYGDKSDNLMSNMLAIYSKMRKITGISKTVECEDYVTDFILSNPGKKIVVFVHHHDVHTLLEANLNKWMADGGYDKCLSHRAGDDGFTTVARFKSFDNCKVLIASTQSSGEGLDGLQEFVSDAIMLERQWNPGYEEQAEDRFHRIGLNHAVQIVYMIATQTIDEYFTEIVEQKRAYKASALDGKEIQWDQNSLMMELANVLLTKGKERWSL